MATFSRSAQLWKREQRAQSDIKAGLVSENFPNVSRITLVVPITMLEQYLFSWFASSISSFTLPLTSG